MVRTDLEYREGYIDLQAQVRLGGREVERELVEFRGFETACRHVVWLREDVFRYKTAIQFVV
jgi:hypothetical protein